MSNGIDPHAGLAEQSGPDDGVLGFAFLAGAVMGLAAGLALAALWRKKSK